MHEEGVGRGFREGPKILQHEHTDTCKFGFRLIICDKHIFINVCFKEFNLTERKPIVKYMFPPHILNICMYLYEENVLHIFQNNVFFFKEMGQKKEEKETKNKKELKLASFDVDNIFSGRKLCDL